MKEIRSAVVNTTDDDMVIVGMPIVFDTPTRIDTESGYFYEVIERHALDDCDLNDSTLRVEHDGSRIPLARSPKTLQLTVTDEGVEMRATLAGDSPQARDAYAAVRRGDLRSMSFAFVVAPAGDTYDAATNTRRIKKIARLLEVSLVAHAAYQGTTVSVEARSQMQREQSRRKVQERAQKLVILCRATKIKNNNTNEVF